MRHIPPTEKKCQRKKQEEPVNKHLQDAAVAGSTPASQSTSEAQGDGQLLQLKILQQLQKVTERLDQVEKRMSMTDRHSTSEKRELSTDSFLENIESCKSKKKVNLC